MLNFAKKTLLLSILASLAACGGGSSGGDGEGSSRSQAEPPYFSINASGLSVYPYAPEFNEDAATYAYGEVSSLFYGKHAYMKVDIISSPNGPVKISAVDDVAWGTTTDGNCDRNDNYHSGILTTSKSAPGALCLRVKLPTKDADARAGAFFLSDKSGFRRNYTVSATPAVNEDGSPDTQGDVLKGDGALLGVVDDGILQSHPEFLGESHAEFFVSSQVDDPENLPMMHGTAVASIALGDSLGVATDGDLLEIHLRKINEMSFSLLDAQLGVEIALQNGAKIINSSYGNDFHYLESLDSSYLTLKEIGAYDALWVSASGNSYLNMSRDEGGPGYFEDEKLADPNNEMAQYVATKIGDPHIKDYHLYVGGLMVDTQDNPNMFNYPGERADIQDVFVVADACPVLSASVYGDGDYAEVCGTSFAAPYVSGVAQLIRARYPELTAVEVRQALLETADRSFTDAYEYNDCGENQSTNCGLYLYGQGKVDADAALNYAANLVSNS